MAHCSAASFALLLCIMLWIYDMMCRLYQQRAAGHALKGGGVGMLASRLVATVVWVCLQRTAFDWACLTFGVRCASPTGGPLEG